MTYRRFAAILAVLAVSAPLGACSDDCTRLADAVCSRVGEESKECKDIRDRAANATQDDKRACGKALEVTHLLTPKS